MCVRVCADVEVRLHHKTITHARYLQQLHNVSRCHIAIDGNDLKAAHITKEYPCNKATRTVNHQVLLQPAPTLVRRATKYKNLQAWLLQIQHI